MIFHCLQQKNKSRKNLKSKNLEFSVPLGSLKSEKVSFRPNGLSLKVVSN